MPRHGLRKEHLRGEDHIDFSLDFLFVRVEPFDLLSDWFVLMLTGLCGMLARQKFWKW